MADTKLNVKMSADRAKVELEFQLQGKAVSRMALSPTALDDLIANLGALRAQMTQPIPAAIEPGAKVETVVNPSWRTDIQAQGPLLAIRHPGFGWQGFLIHPEQGRTLGQGLIDIANSVETSKTPQ
ncbi:hypothetical protein [Brevundimonas sp.]|uniref:hypothetical protein n=1 Tax=Brevundimonas sp. TaxID=1871086 RepID=UPI0019B19F67|nr:hypothetical protein [Brevundimonas sp.]MBD3837029.1 hypothetical protein [Brevundimonas sp.]